MFDNRDITEIFLNITAVMGSVPSCAAKVPSNNAAAALKTFTDNLSLLSSLIHLILFSLLFKNG